MRSFLRYFLLPGCYRKEWGLISKGGLWRSLKERHCKSCLFFSETAFNICFSLNMLLIINSYVLAKVENIDRSVGQQGKLLPRSFLHPISKVGLTFFCRNADPFAELVGVVAVDAKFGEVGHHVWVDGEVWVGHFGL